MSYAAAPGVAWTVDEASEDGPRLLLAEVPDGVPVVLAGSAAQIWLVALECCTLEEVVTRMAQVTGEVPAVLAGPVADLLEGLVARGLLLDP